VKRIPIAGVVLLALFGMACAMEYRQRERVAGRGATRRVPIEQWENEGGALAPAPGASNTNTSQVPH
jgi:hypothetical protein